MRINCVFNLDSVEELRQLTEALEGTATFQAKILLQNQLKELKANKKRIEAQIIELAKERDELRPDSHIKTLKEKEDPVELTDEVAPQPEAQLSLRIEAERVIDNIEAPPNEESQE